MMAVYVLVCGVIRQVLNNQLDYEWRHILVAATAVSVLAVKRSGSFLNQAS